MREPDAILRKLHPDTITTNLIKAAFFLTAYELLKGEIEEKVKSFYVIGFDGGRISPDAEYKTEVLALHKKDPLKASCLWLINSGAFTEAQMKCVLRLRKHRNVIAHELPTLIVEPDQEIDVSLFEEMHNLIRILGKFWARIEIATGMLGAVDSDIPDEDIQSGVMILMDYIRSIVTEPHSRSESGTPTVP